MSSSRGLLLPASSTFWICPWLRAAVPKNSSGSLPQRACAPARWAETANTRQRFCAGLRRWPVFRSSGEWATCLLWRARTWASSRTVSKSPRDTLTNLTFPFASWPPFHMIGAPLRRAKTPSAGPRVSADPSRQRKAIPPREPGEKSPSLKATAWLTTLTFCSPNCQPKTPPTSPNRTGGRPCDSSVCRTLRRAVVLRLPLNCSGASAGSNSGLGPGPRCLPTMPWTPMCSWSSVPCGADSVTPGSKAG